MSTRYLPWSLCTAEDNWNYNTVHTERFPPARDYPVCKCNGKNQVSIETKKMEAQCAVPYKNDKLNTNLHGL